MRKSDIWKTRGRVEMEASTYIEEGAGVLQHQLAGVGFILTVIHIDMELISLQEERR